MRNLWLSFKRWAVDVLGGVWREDEDFWWNRATDTDHLIAVFRMFPETLQHCATAACEQIRREYVGYKNPARSMVSNGVPHPEQDIRRDATVAICRFLCRKYGESFRDSDVHLACEIYHRVWVWSGPVIK